MRMRMRHGHGWMIHVEKNDSLRNLSLILDVEIIIADRGWLGVG